ncbi:alcohol dehydrogenase [Trifolium repens]|nr:alcohol dehydrogenase [Trifolium repens]
MNQLLTTTTKNHTTTKTIVVISQSEEPKSVEVSQLEPQTNSRRKETGAPPTTSDGGHEGEKNTRRMAYPIISDPLQRLKLVTSESSLDIASVHSLFQLLLCTPHNRRSNERQKKQSGDMGWKHPFRLRPIGVERVNNKQNKAKQRKRKAKQTKNSKKKKSKTDKELSHHHHHLIIMSNTTGQVIKCRAAVAWEAGKPLVIEEVEVAPPQAGEVRLKILFTSLCHTDVYFWEAKGQTPLFPRIFGHEAGGIVESVGEGVTHLKPGDHALPVFTGECGECPHCKSEESNMCNLLRINTDRGVMINDNKSRFSIKGQPVHHFVGTSTFSEYTVVHAGCVAKINPDAPLDKVCILSCGICTGLGATVNVAKPKPGSSVAIFGLGAVGLAAAEGARMSGASRIIGIDLVSSRFELAKKFGVNEFVNPKDHDKPVQQVIAEMTDGGVDRAVECTGSIQAMISAFECVHDGWGVAVLVGVPNKDDAFKTHPMNFLNERTLKGTFYGNYKPRTDLPNVVEQYMKGELELEKFITHSIPFSEINKAFDYMLKGESIRCIIRMGE